MADALDVRMARLEGASEQSNKRPGDVTQRPGRIGRRTARMEETLGTISRRVTGIVPANRVTLMLAILLPR